MEVDSDVIDSQLLQQFSSMGTNDKEVLIAEFQRLLGDQLNAAGCAFYLDMNNWNLQAAICSYYDLEQPQVKLPSMSFVKDITIGEGESIPPCTPFLKTWRILNSGDEVWPPGCNLKFVNGAHFSHPDRVMVEAVRPGATTDISIEMLSPSDTGLHQGQWRMSTPTGTSFGEYIWVIVQVEENGLMGVTQQLSQIGTDFIHQSPQHPVLNPFASPGKHDQAPDGPLTPNSSPHLSSLNPQLCSNTFDPGSHLLGSPMGSDIAQHGSFPNSPCVAQGVQGNEAQDPVASRTADGIRTALFPLSGVENLVANTNVIPAQHMLEAEQTLHVPVCPPEEQNELTDSIEMS